MANKHLIGKQIFDLSLGAAEDSTAIQQRLRKLLFEDLVPQMTSLFDKMVPEDTLVRVDKLELQMGNIRQGDLGNGLFIKKIIGRLEAEFSKIKNSPHQDILNPTISGGRTIYQPLRTGYFHSWLHWLESGCLPSHSIQPEDNWMELVLETLAMDYGAVAQLETTLKKSRVAIERLVAQHRTEDLKSLVELYTAHSQSKLLGLLTELKSISGRDAEKQLWKLIFQNVIIGRKKLDSTNLGRILLSHPEVQLLKNKILGSKKKYPRHPLLIELFKEDNTEFDDRNKIELALESAGEEGSSELMTSPQYFNNAGMILLHPFLKALFEKLGFLKGFEFVDHNCHSKAVILLHFLVTGEDKVPEYELILPKFLCEMPANIPIDHRLRLSKKEKKEATDLLLVAIDHWGALGNTSPDGLREGFLIREGKLEQRRQGWSLVVAQKAQDLLLDKLPWNLSMVKLPWMKELLKVEWR